MGVHRSSERPPRPHVGASDFVVGALPVLGLHKSHNCGWGFDRLLILIMAGVKFGQNKSCQALQYVRFFHCTDC